MLGAEHDVSVTVRLSSRGAAGGSRFSFVIPQIELLGSSVRPRCATASCGVSPVARPPDHRARVTVSAQLFWYTSPERHPPDRTVFYDEVVLERGKHVQNNEADG